LEQRGAHHRRRRCAARRHVVRCSTDCRSARRRAAVPRTRISRLVNTHSNGDHCTATNSWLVPRSSHRRPRPTNLRTVAGDDGNVRQAPEMGKSASFPLLLQRVPFHEVKQTLPTRTFEARWTRRSATSSCTSNRLVRRYAATRSTCRRPHPFTGVLFIQAIPSSGQVSRQLDRRATFQRARRRHRRAWPRADHRQTRRTAVRNYTPIRDEARKRFDAGMAVYDAAVDISLVDYIRGGTPNASS
jgi:hypothetical protein